MTLNMLLSFAQFEREVTGERIRDKLAATKKKGLWVTGQPPLGYKTIDRELIAIPEEAELVIKIYEGYLEQPSLIELAARLNHAGGTTKHWLSSRGRWHGGNISETKKIDYRTWAGQDVAFEVDYATLQDEYGNIYKRIRFGLGSMPVGRAGHTSIRPGESITDLLVFERPIDAAKALRLELPAENFGGDGVLRIEIPIDRVE